MTYTPHVWSRHDKLDSAALNDLEQAVGEVSGTADEANAAASAAASSAAQVAATIGPTSTTTVTTAHNLWTDPNTASAATWIAKADTISIGTTADPYVRATSTSSTSGLGMDIHSHDRPPVPAGVTRVWVKAEARSALGGIGIQLQSLAGATSLSYQTFTLSVNATWTPIAHAFDLPATTDNYRLTFYPSGTVAAGDSFDVRHIGVLDADVDQFAGDTPDADGGVYTWDGTANASTSTAVITTTTTPLGGLTVVEAVSAVQNSANVNTAAVATLDAVKMTPVPAPAGFALRRIATPNVFRVGRGAYITTLDYQSMKPAPGELQWVTPAGSSSADGNTAATATNIATALSRTAGTIRCLPGEYRNDLHAVPSVSRDITWIADGPGVTITGYAPAPTWTKNGNVYTAALDATNVIDPRATHDTDGIHTAYTNAGTAAAVTGPGMWANESGTLTVWPLDNTDLTAAPDTLRITTKIRTGVYSFAGTTWAEGISFEGCWDSGLEMSGGTLIAVDCQARYSADNGVHGHQCLAIMVRCDASGNGQDGFNYHETTGAQMDFIEIDCTGRRNGNQRMNTNNGTTSHESSHGLRLNGVYADNFGPQICDVNGAQSWSLGMSSTRTDPNMLPATTQQGHFHCDGTTAVNAPNGGACMFVQDSTATGLGTAWVASSGASVMLRSEKSSAATLMDARDTATIRRF